MIDDNYNILSDLNIKKHKNDFRKYAGKPHPQSDKFARRVLLLLVSESS